jgi:Tol biopolymer transport system component
VVSHRLGEPQQIVIVDPATGKEHPLPVPSLRAYNSITWAPGTSSLLVSGSERPVNQRGLLQIREVSEGGETRPITQDLNNYYSVSVTRDGSTISAVQIERRGGVDIAPVSDGTVGQFTELLPVSASSAGLGGITWLSPDRLAHTMMQGEVQQIFVTDIGSKSTRALTSGPSHRDPDASHDGKVLAMVRDEGDQSHVWRMDVETGRLQRLSDGAFDAYPIALSDGSWILFSSARESFQLMKVAGTGGPSIEITRQTTYCVDVTPDDRDALCIMFDAAGATKPVMIPVGGGEPRPIPDTHEAARYARMGPDGHTITYLMSHDGADEIWSMPPQGGERRLVRFPEGVEIDSYAWSPDGSRLAVVKVTASGDVVLLKRPKS